MFRRKHLLNVFFLLLAMPGLALAGEILTGVEYKMDKDFIHIQAKFGDKVDYVKHFPSSRGKITQIQIKLSGNKFDERSQKRRETIEPDKNAPSVVRDVIYEGNVRGGPYLVIRFSSVVRFDLKKEKNSNVLTVSIDRKELDALEEVKQQTTQADTAQVEENSRADQLMREGRRFLTQGQNGEAILSFSEILNLPNNKQSQDAKEYLGLARERNGQLDMAKQQYEEYLKQYEKTPKANTVRQRLMTLNARLEQIERQLKEGKRQKKRQAQGKLPGDMFGRIAQLSYNAALQKEGESPEVAQSRILSFLDITKRWRDEDKDARLTFSGSNDADFRGGGSETFGSVEEDSQLEKFRKELELETRIRAAFGEYKGRKNKIHAALGRQSVNSGGILGRFDGLLLGYEVKKDISVYGVFGAPVDYEEHNKIQTNKPMFGGRVDFNKLGNNWKASLYGIQQQVDGLLERRAVGGDVRYFFDKRIFYSLVDYDISYQTLNFFTGHFGWQLNEKTKFDIHVDSRRSPVMLTSNALNGIGTVEDPTELNMSTAEQLRILKEEKRTIGELSKYLTEAEIRKRAEDYTGHSSLVTLGANRELAKDLTLIANFTLASYKAGVAQLAFSDDDEELSLEEQKNRFLNPFEASNTDAIGALQLVKRNLFKPRDIVLMGIRATYSKDNRRYSANGTLRMPLKEKWWLDLRGRLMYTQNIEQDESSVRLSPTARAEYRFTKKMTFELEAGVDVNRSDIANQDLGWYFINGGYRYLF